MSPEREPAEGRDARAEAAGAAGDVQGGRNGGPHPRSAPFMAARYGWTPAEQRRFAFLRWLVQTGRLRP